MLYATQVTLPIFTPAVLDVFAREYPKLQIQPADSSPPPAVTKLEFDGGDEDIQDLRMDIEFLKLVGGGIPLENICSRRRNYRPINESQVRMVDSMDRLLLLDMQIKSAGLFISGPAGVGKTHCAIAIAKIALMRGLRVFYVTPETSSRFDFGRALEQDGLWILDDMNSPYGMYADIFKKKALMVHNKGGRLLVTANISLDEFLAKLYFSEPADRIRWDDRVRGMLLHVPVSGESQRRQQRWWLPQES